MIRSRRRSWPRPCAGDPRVTIDILPGLAPVLAAPFAGSFCGVLVRRIPAGQPIALARSRCDSCGTALGWRDLVPLASFAMSGGRCRHCGKPIGVFHPAIELAAVAVALCAVWLDEGAAAWLDCGLGWTLLTLAWIDRDWMLLPDILTLPLLLTGLAVAWFDGPEALTQATLGAAAGWLGFTLIAVGYRRLRGRDGLGLGDAKLLAAGGAWVGIGLLPTVILLAAVVALTVAVPARLLHGTTSADTPLPFGPWLALGIWIVWLLR